MPWEGLAANRDHSIGVVRRSVTPIANKVDMQIFSIHSLHGFFNASTWLTAIIGAAVLLLAYHLTSRRSGGSRSRSGRRYARR